MSKTFLRHKSYIKLPQEMWLQGFTGNSPEIKLNIDFCLNFVH